MRLTKTGCESGVGLGHVDALVEDVRGGGGGLSEDDGVREGCRVGGPEVCRRLSVVGRGGVWCRVSRLRLGQLRPGVAHGLLLLDVGGGGGPPAGPHPGVGGVGLVLGPRPLEVLLQVTVDISVV